MGSHDATKLRSPRSVTLGGLSEYTESAGVIMRKRKKERYLYIYISKSARILNLLLHAYIDI